MESIYGPYRRITAVGEHLAGGTLVTLECGHTWTLVSHMHIDEQAIGQAHPCGKCRDGIGRLCHSRDHTEDSCNVKMVVFGYGEAGHPFDPDRSGRCRKRYAYCDGTRKDPQHEERVVVRNA